MPDRRIENLLRHIPGAHNRYAVPNLANAPSHSVNPIFPMQRMPIYHRDRDTQAPGDLRPPNHLPIPLPCH